MRRPLATRLREGPHRSASLILIRRIRELTAPLLYPLLEVPVEIPRARVVLEFAEGRHR